MNQSSYEYVLDQPSPKSQPPELHFPSTAYARHTATGSAYTPKPHPHLASQLFQPQTTVLPDVRLMPDVYYDWMPRSVPKFAPSPSEFYDAIRPWGSLKSVSTWLAGVAPEDPAIPDWFAKVEFWYADEAQRFETDFGQTGSLIKGWKVVIWGNTPVPFTDGVLPCFAAPLQPPIITADIFAPGPYDPLAPAFFPSPFSEISHSSFPPVMIPPPLTMQPFFPPTPPSISSSPPWATHNPFAYKSRSPPDPSRKLSGKSSVTSLRNNGSGLPLNAGPRRWSLTMGETPDGVFQPTGLVSDDGKIIQHGQHIRPAPAFGPGSQSASGLVDYSNIFVKNLDPDINSFFLEETFSQFGRIISARVMRDDHQRSRGYGFVSFYTPEEAACAVKAMNGTQFGRQVLSVTLHEPRKLRPEKIAERVAQGLIHRQASPIKSRRSFREMSTCDRPNNSEPLDDIRLLSPESRKAVLEKRLIARVRVYAKKRSVSEGMIQPIVNSLLPSDLALISLLHNRTQLDNRIAETLFSIQEVPEMPAAAPRPTKRDIDNLCIQIQKIDPDDVEHVMRILLDLLKMEDWEMVLGSKAEVVIKYGEAKRLVLKERSERQKESNEDVHDKDAVVDDPISETGLSDERDVTIPLETVTVPLLASLSAKEIVRNLSSSYGSRILLKLGLKAPSEQEKNTLLAWRTRVASKGKVIMRAEIVGMLERHAVGNGLKRSQRIKTLREFVNAEDDDESLCELVLYPALLNAKLECFISSRGSQ
ncbi:hypothetical protein I307_05029 [Cryptococcus deuterogattii 99/473]|uniref:RRM domain-containing protein n=1 Tax=Cryptococcus deuterogattii Ram5 TaxID=1296110 RepID=A0A0D0SY56_9TREE|nr:hypothetical protein I313_06082 [Cryptococcus deuterogattii Ram5]KIY55632.1 hypothetical protein I307_05029 [Cryptococcus deuterogattii 99/473]